MTRRRSFLLYVEISIDDTEDLRDRQDDVAAAALTLPWVRRVTVEPTIEPEAAPPENAPPPPSRSAYHQHPPKGA